MRLRLIALGVVAGLLAFSLARADDSIPRYIPNDPLSHAQWNFDSKTGPAIDPDIDAPEAWSEYLAKAPQPQPCTSDPEAHARGEHCHDGFSRQLVWIGFIGTGIRLTHPEFADRIGNPGEDINGDHRGSDEDADGIDNDGNGYFDDVWGIDYWSGGFNPDIGDVTHATGWAGLIGGHSDNGAGIAGVHGLGPEVHFIICRAADHGVTSSSSANLCLDYFLRLKALGANMPIVLTNFWGSFASARTQMLLEQSRVSGMLLICSAGDYGFTSFGSNIDTQSRSPASLPYDNILSVAGTDHTGRLAYWSNFGPLSVDVAAPASEVPTTNGGVLGYGTLIGSHVGAAQVAGLAALLWSHDPSLRLDDPDPDGDGPLTGKPSYLKIKERIMSTVVKDPSLEGKTVTGGRINAWRALANRTDIDP